MNPADLNERLETIRRLAPSVAAEVNAVPVHEQEPWMTGLALAMEHAARAAEKALNMQGPGTAGQL